MHFSGVSIANGKAVMAQYNPGWGEPGEWYLNFSDKTQLTIDNVEGMGDQESYLKRLSGDKYRDAVILSNWETLGNSDDVVRKTLEYLGYNDANRAEDKKRLDQEASKIRVIAQSITGTLEENDFSLEALSKNVKDLERSLKESTQFISSCHDRIRVYDELNAGNKVGFSWSNETFIRDFPKSNLLPRVKKLMNDSKKNKA